MSKGGRVWKGKVLAPVPSVVFHGRLGTYSFLKIAFVFLCFENFFISFMITIVSVLKSVIKCFENFCLKSVLKVYGVKIGCFEQVLKNFYLLAKDCSFSYFL